MSAPAALRSRPMLIVVLGVVLAVFAGLSVLAAAAAGGDDLVLMDAGPIARHGAPIASMLADLAAALTLGGAMVAGWLLREDPDRARVMIAVGIAAAITTLARGTSLAFSYAVATGQPVGSPRFGSDLGVFVATDLGIWLLIGSAIVRSGHAGDGRAANRSLLVDPNGTITARYDKLHVFDVDLPNGERYRESATVRPGDGVALID